MNGRCSICNTLLSTGDMNGVCNDCEQKRIEQARYEREERNTAQYRTYENGYHDGFRDAQEALRKSWEELGKATACIPLHTLIVTQEMYDNLKATPPIKAAIPQEEKK